MKYNVKRVTFSRPLSCVGGSAWMSHIKQCGITSVEFDDDSRLLTLSGTAEKIRVPVEAVAEMVFAATTAANANPKMQAGG